MELSINAAYESVDPFLFILCQYRLMSVRIIYGAVPGVKE